MSTWWLERLVARLARGGQRHPHGDRRDGDVEEEDRLPGDVLDEEAADDGADGERHRAHAGPGADRAAALLRREGVRDDREGRGHHERGADALCGAAGDEPGLALREADEGARQAEDDDAEEEHAPAAEDVAEASARDEEDGEGEGVGVDGPLEAGDRAVQILLDRRQRDVHDRVVEHDHEEREAHRAQGPPAAVVVGDGGTDSGHVAVGEVGERGHEAGPLLGGERRGELLEAFEAGLDDAAGDVAAGVGDPDPLHPPVLLVLAALEVAATHERVDGPAAAGEGEAELLGDLLDGELAAAVGQDAERLDVRHGEVELVEEGEHRPALALHEVVPEREELTGELRCESPA